MAFESKTQFSSHKKNIPPKQAPQQGSPAQVVSPKSDFLPEVNLQPSGLPSKGLLYPASAMIKYRPFTFGEVKKVSQSIKMTEKEVFEFSLSGVECSFDKNLLTIPDAMYIGFLRKISSFGTPSFVAVFDCMHCGAKKERGIVHSKSLEFADLEVPKLPVCAELSFGTHTFVPANIGMYYELFGMGKHHDEIALLAMECTSMEYKEAYDRIYNASSEDGFVLNEVDRVMYHGLKPTQLKCSQCSQSSFIELDGGQALLIPFREHEVPVKSRIHFGDAS